MKNDKQDYFQVPTDERLQERAIELTPPTEVKDGKKEKEKLETVGIFELFRYSNGLDRFLMFMGFICAMSNGSSIPILMIIFGEMVDTFVGTGIFVNFLATVPQYLESINATALQVLANPLLLDCREVDKFYGSNSSNCFGSFVKDRLSEDMRLYAFYYCMIGCVVLVMAYGQVTFWMTAAERQAHRIRQSCLNNVLRQNIGWFDVHSTAELNTRLGEDVQKIQEGMSDKVGAYIQWTTCAVANLIIGVAYGWKQALVILAICPVLVVTSSLFSKLASNMSRSEMEAYAKAGAIAEETLGAIRTVVAFGGQEKGADKYKKNLASAQAFGIKKGLTNGLALGMVWMAVYCCYSLGFWYGGKLYREEDYEISQVLIVAFTILISAFSLGMAAPSLQVITSARGAAHVIYGLIDSKSKIDSSSEEGLKPASMQGNIELKDVYFNYPARPDVKVLQGISLEAKRGQAVALVGSSGYGKSTIVQLLLRFYDPLQGQVMIDGHNVKDLNIKWLRNNVGLVSQEPILFATTIAENIRYGREDVTMEEIEAATKNANAFDFIMNLPDKFETLVGERGSQLSGGQKQRLAIARALVRDPKILLLDEATSALDTENESIVQDALDKAREGRTTIIIAHRLSTIKNADIIFGMNKGKVAEMGTHNGLMEKKGIYYQLVMNQQAALEEEEEFEELINHDKHKLDNDAGHKVMTTSTENEDKKNEKEKDLPPVPIGRLLKLNSREWPFIALGCVASLANGTVLPAFAIILSRIIQIFSYPDLDRQEEEMTHYSLLFVGIGLLSFFSFFIQSYMFGRSGEALTTRLRDMSFRAILRQDIAFFDKTKNNVGALTTRLATDASLVQGVTGPRMGAILNSVSNIGTALIISFVYGWKMTLVIIVFLPFMILGGITQIGLLSGQAGKNKEALEEAGKITVESLGNIRTVASLTKESKFLNRYMASLAVPYRSALKNCHAIGISYAFSQCLLFFAYAASFSFGAYMIEEGEMDFDDVFLVFTAIVIGSLGLGLSAAFLPDLGKAKLSSERIMHIIDSEPTIDYSSSDGEKLGDEYKAEVTFNDVEFSYPNRKAANVLQGVTFSVSPGQTLALVGSSGCGKSTTVQLVERFYDTDSGLLAIDSHDIRGLNIKWLREQIGVVFQEPVLFDASIAENIAYGDNTRKVPMQEIIEAARNANIHSFISSLPDGYETNVGSRGTQLSGGEKQRVAIARVLVRNPKILLLDEATSALDTESEKVVQEALDKAVKGRTCIVIAHRLSTVQTSDQICVVSHGRVSESGTHSKLMAKQGFYFKLVKKSQKES